MTLPKDCLWEEGKTYEESCGQCKHEIHCNDEEDAAFTEALDEISKKQRQEAKMKWIADTKCSVCGREAKDGEMFIFILKPIDEWTKFMDGTQYCPECHEKREQESKR